MRQKKKPKKNQAALYKEELKNLQTCKPLCQHFRQCGGCDLQHYSYENQVNAKLNVFKSMVDNSYAKRAFKGVEITSLSSHRQSRYRQKMDFVCAFGKSGLRGNSFDDVVELNDCHLVETDSFSVYKEAVKAAKEAELDFYDYIKHQGYLRYITIRRTRTGQQLLSFLTSSIEHGEKIEAIAKQFLDSEKIDSFVWQMTGGKTDTSFGSPYKVWGKDLLEEKMLEHRFKLTTNTFFQANQEVAEEAYRQIREYARSFEPETLLDLYSGTCTIGITMSSVAKRIIAVENFLPNRDMALKNFELNNISNIEYIDNDVADYMESCEESPEFVVCNPPRTGVDERPLRALVKLKPKGISYLSCNPKTLLDDLAVMSLNYKIENATVLDMFPQTKHFETLIQLRRKDV